MDVIMKETNAAVVSGVLTDYSIIYMLELILCC